MLAFTAIPGNLCWIRVERAKRHRELVPYQDDCHSPRYGSLVCTRGNILAEG